jgi:hypothetical protein
MKLFNVRLEPEDARKADALRRAGVRVSTVVREAIRAEYSRRVETGRSGVRASDVVAEVIAAFPAKVGRAPVDTADRVAVRRHIRAQLGARRP